MYIRHRRLAAQMGESFKIKSQYRQTQSQFLYKDLCSRTMSKGYPLRCFIEWLSILTTEMVWPLLLCLEVFQMFFSSVVRQSFPISLRCIPVLVWKLSIVFQWGSPTAIADDEKSAAIIDDVFSQFWSFDKKLKRINVLRSFR